VGLIFGLPHLVYLATSSTLTRTFDLTSDKSKPLEILIFAFVAQSLCLLGQANAVSITALILWRLGMGLSMTAGFISLHQMISRVTQKSQAGGFFGWLEGCVKASSIIGGIIASFGFKYNGANSLFVYSASLFIFISVFIGYRTWSVNKERPA
jgi:hypothetical protein